MTKERRSKSSAKKPVPAIYILGPDIQNAPYKSELLKDLSEKKLVEGKDFIFVGSGINPVKERDLRKKITGRIGPKTRIFCDGHGLVEDIEGTKKHTIDILTPSEKDPDQTTEYLLNLLQDIAGKQKIYIDILSCYGGKTKEHIKNLVCGSVLQSHATDSHISYMDQNKKTSVESIARHCSDVRQKDFDMMRSLAVNFMHNQCLTIETHNISIAKDATTEVHHTSRSPDKAKVLKKEREFKRYITKQKFPEFFKEFVEKVYSPEETKNLEQEIENIAISKYFKTSEYNYGKKTGSGNLYDLALFGLSHAMPWLADPYIRKVKKTPNFMTRSSVELLHVAALENGVEIMENFFSASPERFKKEINSVAEEDSEDSIADKTPLIIAIENNNFNFVESALQKGADPNMTDDGPNPLHPLIYAASIKDPEAAVKMAELLIDKGASPFILQQNRTTPLHTATASGNKKLAELFLRKGADMNAMNRQQEAPLSLALRNGHYEVAELLLQKGASPDTSLNGNIILPPIVYASVKKDYRMVEMLLEHGANPNIQADGGKTALYAAVSTNNFEMVKLLTEKGANPEKENNLGNSPLSLSMMPEISSKIRNFLIDTCAEKQEKTKHQDKVKESRSREHITKKKDHTAGLEKQKSHIDKANKRDDSPKR